MQVPWNERRQRQLVKDSGANSHTPQKQDSQRTFSPCIDSPTIKWLHVSQTVEVTSSRCSRSINSSKCTVNLTGSRIPRMWPPQSTHYWWSKAIHAPRPPPPKHRCASNTLNLIATKEVDTWLPTHPESSAVWPYRKMLSIEDEGQLLHI